MTTWERDGGGKLIKQKLFHSPTQDRWVCEPCANGTHDRWCEKYDCKCMCRERVKTAKKVDQRTAQEGKRRR
jgi:hypothetical protein